MTPEQLKAMSDYEINCAVAKIQLVKEDERLKGVELEVYRERICGRVSKNHSITVPVHDCCGDPRVYMPIVIEHCINIGFSIDYPERKNVIAEHRPLRLDRAVVKVIKPRAEVGRAVCEAFLMMEVGK